MVVALAMFALLILVRPSLWTSQLMSYFNSQLSSRYGLQVETANLTGNFLNQLEGESVIVSTDSDSILFTAEGISINYSLWKIVIGQFAIDKIHLIRPVVHFGPGYMHLLTRLKSGGGTTPSPEKRQFTIENLSIEEGQFIYPTAGEQVQVTQITGAMKIHQGPEALTITGDFSSLKALETSQRLRSIKFLVHQYADSIVVDNAQFKYDSAAAEIHGAIGTNPLTGLSLKYRVDQFSLGNVLPFLGIDSHLHDQWSVQGSVQSDLKTWNVTTAFDGHIVGDTKVNGTVHAQVTGGALFLQKAPIQVGTSNLNLTGEYQFGTGGQLNISLAGLNLAEFLEDIPPTNFGGNVAVKETSGNLAHPKLLANIDVNPATINGYNFTSAQGNIKYVNDTLRVDDSLKVRMAATQALFRGWYYIPARQLAANIRYQTQRFDYITDMLHLPKIYGEANGFIRATGTMDSTAVTGRVQMKNFGYQNFHFADIAGYFDFTNVQKVGPGNLFVEARNGLAWGQDVASGSLTLQATRDTIRLRGLRFENGEDHLYLSGKMSKDLTGVIQTVELRFGETFAHNRTQLPFQIQQRSIYLSKGVIGLNDGFLSFQGKVGQTDSLSTNVEFTNINITPLNQLLQTPLPFTGTLNGEVTYRNVKDKQFVQSNLLLSDVFVKDLQYSQVRLKGNYYNGLVKLEQGYFRSPAGGEITATGQFPWDLEKAIQQDTIVLGQSMPIQGKIDLSAVHLGKYSPYIPLAQDIAGLATGEVTVSGDWGAPVMQADLTVLQPRFDRITGDSLVAEIQYADNQLNFQELYLDEGAPGNIFTGGGTLPLHMDFAAGEIRLDRDREMNLHFEGNTTHLQFLERYMGDVDAINGEFSLSLDVLGTPNNPIRNGSFTARNGQVEVTTLENEVTDVSASGVLRNNKMTINSFSAQMHKEREREIIQGTFNRIKHWFSKLFNREIPAKGDNVNVTGTLDFRKFFNPGLNLALTGNKIYIRSLLSEVEGVVGANLTLTGRDSLIIAGAIDPEEMVLRMDFAKEGTPREPSTGKGRYIEYNLHAVFPGDFYIRNNQVNAEFEGDLYILRHGDESTRFSGVLNVIRGKFYYNGTFNIEEGQITFDPVEFNPRLNIVATTKIENVQVTITLTGEMDDPTISLAAADPEDPNKQYSQSEILSLLTFNQQIEQEGLVTPDIQPVLSAYLERQLESYGNQLIGLETFNVETQGQSLQEIQAANKPVTVTVGRRVTSNLYFTYKRDFFSTNPNNLIGLEYQLNRYMSLVGQVDENGLYHFNYRLKYNY